MKPQLKQIDLFKKILSNYQVSPEGKELLDETKLVIMTAPTGAGRNRIINELIKTGPYEFIVSDTTRPKRKNDGVLEEDGVQYWFRSEEEMIQDLKEGLFLEADVIHNQQVSGISLRELKRVADMGKIAIDEVYYIGADNIHRAKPDAYILFVLPPSYDVWMERLFHRGEMSNDEVKNRLKSAEKELETTSERDYYRFVVNDKLSDTVATVRRIVEDNEYTEEEHQAGRDLAWELLSQVKRQLYS